jgi:hypothetical protein
MVILPHVVQFKWYTPQPGKHLYVTQSGWEEVNKLRIGQVFDLSLCLGIWLLIRTHASCLELRKEKFVP